MTGIFCAVFLALTGCKDVELPKPESVGSETATEITETTETASVVPTQVQTEIVTETVTEAVVPVTQPPTEEATVMVWDTEKYVVSAREEHYNYTDKTGNVYDVTMRMPKINTVDGVSFDDVNEQIVSDCQRYFDEADKEMADKVSMVTLSMDYDAYVTDGVISISVTQTSSFGGMKNYYIYNADTETGNFLSDREFAQKLGLSEEELKEKITASLKDDYNERYNKEGMTEYEENLAKTLAEENISQCKVFIAENGQLMALCTEYTQVGAGRYSYIITLP